MTSSEPDYGGMTVNERLLSRGLLNEFEDAVQERSRSRMIEILSRVEMTRQQSEETVDAILVNPRKYGF